MQVPFVDLSAIHKPLEKALKDLFSTVLEESYFVHGKQVSTFENAFANAHHITHCQSTGNCTDALYIVLKALGIGPGDEVLVPAMTWITDAETVSLLGAEPIFVDVDEFGLLNVNFLEEKISPKTTAIIPVHLYGRMADMETVMQIAQKHELKVIEDCAQSVFASRNGKLAGTFGHAAVYSFYPTKNLGALGDAGAILTNNKALFEACRKLANHGALDKHNHEFPGTNSRMDTLQAAVLLLKLPYVQQWNEERLGLAKNYNKAFASIKEIGIPECTDGHVFHVYAIQTKKRNELKSHLKSKGIQTQIHYPQALPFTKAYAYQNATPADFPRAYKLQEQGLSLPLFPRMTQEQQAYVIKCVGEFYKC
ncbi:DegT/DnrJ/EryC1/StrS family aminotransferase [Roseivirga pacifica]